MGEPFQYNIGNYKTDTAKKIVPFFKELNSKYKKVVKYVCCDNTGENTVLQKACKATGMGVQFEYTAPGTPHNNGHVEHKFATLFGRVCSMLSHADHKDQIRKGVWAEARGTATVIDVAIVTATKPVASYMQFYEKESKYIWFLNTFGEAGVVLDQ
jgi:hypothetical protein